MSVAIEETNQASTLSATSLLLPSWSVVEDEFIAVAVGLRDENVIPTVAGNGITFDAEFSIIGTQTQSALYLFRGQVPANDTGQVTITLGGNGDPVAGIGVRVSGQELGNNGADAIDASASDPGPAVDDDDMKIDITTVADNCLLIACGTHRLSAFTPPAGQTTLEAVVTGGGGSDSANTDLWRLDGLKSPAGLVTMGQDNSLSTVRDWIIWALSLKPASAAPASGGGSPPSSVTTLLGM